MQPNNKTNHFSALHVEVLEDRTMLSTLQVIASGDTGQEEMLVRLDGSVFGEVSVSQQAETYTFELSTPFEADQIRIEFLNDAYDPGQNLDRNLRIDAIIVDGVRFETESSNVFSTGSWRPEDGVTPGNGRGEVLHSNGYFDFGGANTGTVIEFAARGDEGTEQFGLVVRDVVVANYTASTFLEGYTYIGQDGLTANDIRIQFFNDRFDPANGIDSNLFVDYVSVDGVRFETEDPSVFSTATWRPEDGIVAGNGRGEYLNTNGYFQYSGPGEAGTTINVVARGSEGTEQFRLIVDGETIGTQTVGTSDQFFLFDVAGDVAPEDVRIEFINDQYDPANGIDSNLTVNMIFIGDQGFPTESNTVFSTGSYGPDGIVPGFGRGETLHVNGYFEYGVLPEAARYRVTFDASWSPDTHPNGAFAAGGHFSGLVGATHLQLADFWSVGESASAGIEDVAETGSKTQFINEINQAINSGNAENLLSGGGITNSPDSVSLEFDVSATNSLVTLISMLAPSPDWFVGVDSLPLINNGGWIESQTISLNVYDAGTDNGANFNSPDIDNQNGTITRITDGPLSNNDSVAPVGTFRFERIG